MNLYCTTRSYENRAKMIYFGDGGEWVRLSQVSDRLFDCLLYRALKPQLDNFEAKYG